MRSYALTPSTFILVCAAAVGLVACGPSPEEPTQEESPTYSPETSKAALDFVIQHVADIHLETQTGLPPDFAIAVDEARAALSQPIPQERLLFVIDEALATLRDAHTFVDTKPIATVSKDVIPLPVAWLSEGLVVTADAGALRRGDVVDAIGDKSPAELLEDLRRVIPSENDHHLRDRAARLLSRTDYLRQLDLVDGRGDVSIRVERNGAPFSASIAPTAPQAAPSPGVAVDMDAGASLAVLRMDTCVYDADFEATLASFFGDVAKMSVPRVVVDLRQNEGGNVLAAFAFLRYIKAAENMAAFGVKLRISDDLLEQFPVFGAPEVLSALEAFGVDTKGDVYDIPGPVMGTLLSSQLPPNAVDPALMFSGKLVVLVSSRTFSSANLFATLVKDNHLGTVVGEPTGNEVDFHGQNLSIEVPGTDLWMSVSSSRNRRPDTLAPNEPSLTPDEIVPVTRESILKGTDPALDWVRAAPL